MSLASLRHSVPKIVLSYANLHPDILNYFLIVLYYEKWNTHRCHIVTVIS